MLASSEVSRRRQAIVALAESARNKPVSVLDLGGRRELNLGRGSRFIGTDVEGTRVSSTERVSESLLVAIFADVGIERGELVVSFILKGSVLVRAVDQDSRGQVDVTTARVPRQNVIALIKVDVNEAELDLASFDAFLDGELLELSCEVFAAATSGTDKGNYPDVIIVRQNLLLESVRLKTREFVPQAVGFRHFLGCKGWRFLAVVAWNEVSGGSTRHLLNTGTVLGLVGGVVEFQIECCLWLFPASDGLFVPLPAKGDGSGESENRKCFHICFLIKFNRKFKSSLITYSNCLSVARRQLNRWNSSL